MGEGGVSPTWASALLAAGVSPDEDAPGIRSPSISSWKDGKAGGFLSRKTERGEGRRESESPSPVFDIFVIFNNIRLFLRQRWILISEG